LVTGAVAATCCHGNRYEKTRVFAASRKFQKRYGIRVDPFTLLAAPLIAALRADSDLSAWGF
jgi:hypothetical protein